MEKNNNLINVEQKKIFKLNNPVLLNEKWGYIMNTQDNIYNIFSDIKNNHNIESQSFYSIGQGINENKSVFIHKKHLQNINQKNNIISAVYKESSYFYNETEYFLYHSFTKDKKDALYLKSIGAEELAKGKELKRKYPTIIMPRGIGDTHFAGILPAKTLSNSYVDIYMDKPDEEKSLNIWLFCNSSLFFLYREISGRKNLGGGLLKAEASDIKNIPLYFPILDKKGIKYLLEKNNKPDNLLKRLENDIQKEIDSLILKYFNISDKNTLIISELKKLYEFRVKKAKSSI
ncbi:MAG: hypothetical protein FWC97_02455 [Treponema sp.]|nr:hypothetical protein [Treponema sp.]